MKHHTEGPYHLTLKSNGCLILISALSPKHLIVASKHSLGTTTETQVEVKDEADGVLVDGIAGLAVKDDNGKGKGKAEDEEHLEAIAHAEVGRIWLRRTLQKSGKTEEDLARRLWDQGLTAVLEVGHPQFLVLIHSSVTTRSKNMSLLLQSTGQVSIFMV
jgi:tRNA ligase